MLMVKRIFHVGARRLPIGFLSTQPAIRTPPDQGAAIIKNLLFAACPVCVRGVFTGNGMGSIPQGVFAARKVRNNLHQCLATPTPTRNDASAKDVFDNKALEQPPLKYNSKLMNSIWGLYNRYSVHNFKKNTDDAMMFGCSSQQCLSDNAAQPVSAEVSVGNGGLGPNNAAPVGGAMNFYRSLAFIVRTI